jgi:acetone carboxylase alpha subunit
MIEKDLANGLVTPAYVRKVHGFAKTEAKTEELRAKIRRQRLDESVPASQWWREERKRARTGDVGKVVAETFARSASLSEKIKDVYLDFWQLKKFPYTDTGTTDFRTTAPTGFYYPKSPQKPYVKGA